MPLVYNPLEGEFNMTTAGTVINPSASSTDNAIVRWSGTNGMVVQDSGWILDDSDQMTVPTGSSAGMCFGDGDSCIYENSDDEIIISTAATTAVTIDATQDVTLAADLDVTGNEIVQGDLTVGNSTRDVSFTINGTAIAATISMEGLNASDLGGMLSHRHSDTAGFGGHMVGLRSRGTHDASTIVQNGDTISLIAGAGYDGTDYALAAQILMQVDGVPGADDMPGRIILSTSQDGAQTPTEAMRIDATQTVTLANPLPVASGGTGSTTLAGAGIVTGPASATDNGVARFDGTTGKVIQNSGLTIDDNENLLSNTAWSGNTKFMGVLNNVNTASTQTKFSHIVGGTSAGDMWTEYRVGSTRSWAEGVDNDDTQSFKITTVNSSSISPSLGTTVFKIDTSGNPTFPAAPLDVASGGTGVTSNTAYAVLCGGTTGTGDVQSIAGVGTSGQVLTSNGAGALPTFQAAAGGGAWSFVTSTTISNDATVEFTGLNESGASYKFVIENWVPITDATQIFVEYSEDNGSSWESGATDYAWGFLRMDDGSLTGVEGDPNDVHAELLFTEAGTGTNESMSGEYVVIDPQKTDYTMGNFHLGGIDAGLDIHSSIGNTVFRTTAAIDAIRFFSSSGNVSTGTIRVYKRSGS